ncbi:MAG: AAA family ATPase [Hyphomicrobiales bacterium]|nr:AAA family ATPase [Hyphomicrobiales bacterium]
MEVDAWLESIELSQYAPLFRKHAIDRDTLRDLDDADLEKLDIPLGHRKRLLRAIAQLKAAPPEFSTERRQICVVFCDLTGSTELSTRLDPEDMRDVIARYQRAVTTAIEKESGYIAKFMGDGVLAYFGYPTAHEDDPERAVRAGLDVVAAVGREQALNGGRLHARVGISTGVVVVGDLLGSGLASERGVVGETPNLAARLQAIAGPDAVVISDSTRRLIGNLFDLQPLQDQALKGFAEPTKAFHVRGAHAIESRFDALRGAALLRLVGRENELGVLLGCWRDACGGAGRAVVVSGEAGIGKSRLAVALIEAIRHEAHTQVQCFCLPQYADSPLYPIISHMMRAAGFAAGDAPGVRYEKLRAELAKSATAETDIELLAELLGIWPAERASKSTAPPQERRRQMFAALGRRVEALTADRPVLLVFEDAHWADPSSLEILEKLIERIEKAKLLLVVTTRPEFRPPWRPNPHTTFMTLGRLSESDLGRLVAAVVGERSLPAGLQRDIVERADGVPLFAEEIAKATLEAASEGAAHQLVTSLPSPSNPIPPSLHASLMARLDRLGSAKDIAQIGAAIGREFSRDLLAAVARRPLEEIGAALDRLVEAGLLFVHNSGPAPTYIFKHALVQDAAYATLLREPRRYLHLRIVEAMEALSPEMIDQEPQSLARHCAEAGLTARAAELWGKAGQRSLARSALIEAEAQLSRALALLRHLPATPDVRREEINLQVALLSPLRHLKGYAAPETRASLDQARILIESARRLGEKPQDPLAPYPLLYSAWLANHSAYNRPACEDIARQMIALAEDQQLHIGVMVGRRMLGTTLAHAGELGESKLHLDAALELYDPAEHALNVRLFQLDCGVAGYVYRAVVLARMGRIDTATADIARGLKLMRACNHAVSSMLMLSHILLVRGLLGPDPHIEAEYAELMELADATGAQYWKALGLAAMACYRITNGAGAEALEMLEPGLRGYRATGATLGLPVFSSNVALANARAGRREIARDTIAESFRLIDASGENSWRPELHIIDAKIHLALDDDRALAETALLHAIDAARAQGARLPELQAATELALLWRDGERRAEAHERLASVYETFTEGRGNGHLERAGAVMAELR